MNEDIAWKIKEAASRIKERYHFIGGTCGTLLTMLNNFPGLAFVQNAGCLKERDSQVYGPLGIPIKSQT